MGSVNENGEIIRMIELIVEPITTAKKIELVDVEYLQEGGYWFVRIYIDKDGGVSLEDCEEVSRFIEEDIDKAIDKKFFLEVSSPGLERPLKKPADFEKFIGDKISVRLKHKIDDEKNFEGKIGKYQDDILYLLTDKGIMNIPFKELERAKLVFDFEELSRRVKDEG